jgi:hypothetical protein
MFYSTHDALKQGYHAEPARKFFWFQLRRRFQAQTTAAIERGCYDLAAMFACQSQFCREAYDAEHVLFMSDHIFEGERRV